MKNIMKTILLCSIVLISCNDAAQEMSKDLRVQEARKEFVQIFYSDMLRNYKGIEIKAVYAFQEIEPEIWKGYIAYRLDLPEDRIPNRSALITYDNKERKIIEFSVNLKNFEEVSKMPLYITDK